MSTRASKVRPPALADAPAIERLINASTEAEVGMIVYQPGELARKWQEGERFDQHLVAIGNGGGVEAILWVEEEEHPHLYFELYLGSGAPDELRAELTHAVERRAEARARATGTRVGLEVNSGEAATTRFLEERGYGRGKTHLAMTIDLDSAPPPAWPEGVRFRPYREGEDDELFFGTLRRGFGDRWEGPAEQDAWFRKHRDAGYVPELWFFAESEAGIVGAVHSRDTWESDVDTGWVRNLSVLPEGRRRGAGRALLLESFHRLAERGRRRAVLGVQDDNAVAIGMYERVGMRASGSSTDLSKTVLPPTRT